MCSDPPPKDLILAFDTASENIALAIGDTHLTLLAHDDHPASRQANVQLMPSVDALFSRNNLDRQRVDAVVCGRGPGSFTGVRIGVATAKGVARGLGVPLYGVSTLDAVAWGAWLNGLRGAIAVLANAMRGEVYPARYTLDNKGAHRLDPHTVAKAAEVAQAWAAANTPLILVGDALYKYADAFTASPLLTLAPQTLWAPTGHGLLCAFEANCQAKTQGDGDPATLLPLYTRLSDAEENERIRLAQPNAPLAQGALIPVPPSGVTAPLPSSLAVGQDVVGQEPLQVQPASPPKGAKPNVPLPLTYRPLAASDLDAATALEGAAFPTSPWTRGMFASELAASSQTRTRTWWAAFSHSQLAGYAGGQVIDGDLQILNLATAPAYRRHGVARTLITHLATDALALGATTASLEVRPSNTAAQSLYHSLGFTPHGLRKNYYPPAKDLPADKPASPTREDALVPVADVVAVLPAPPTREDALILKAPLPLTSPLARSFLAQNAEDPCLQSGQSLLDAPPADKNGSAPPQNPVSPATSQRVHTPQTPLILAIETSCDETAAAIIDGGHNLYANVIASQIDFHARFGGVVPEIASRKHTEAIVGVVDQALEHAQMGVQDLDAIAVTYAPGLIGALVVGVAFAKGLSWATSLPLIRVNHLEGHIYANRFTKLANDALTDIDSRASRKNDSSKVNIAPCSVPPLTPPFVTALLSGGHTMLVQVRGWGDYRILGQTLDDAVGEAFDKVAKALGLGYPGGPVISRLAQQGDPRAVNFPRAMLHSHDLRFSLSGLKTAVITYIKQEQAAGRPLNIPNLAASFEQAVIDVQVAKALTALEQTNTQTFCLGGGVAANKALRTAYQTAMWAKGIQVVFPPPIACTDNAAMIAAVALDRYRQNNFATLKDDAHAQTSLEAPY
ncbi:MAG: tRNA (adenosine(37)-N6)-threonylcarbamoyltransferase complex transferase subunit TsaD [Coriobacteriales bacterium]|jgi:N6-L-threonylcarbamoyladenine synthase|nr:tRNA (adenosine(37)-N6)-threonylcarbamoyltransferase complex transferase subunit TsaD [Coriobacteriales bacterium]